MLSELKPKISSDYILYRADNSNSNIFVFNINEGTMFQLNEVSYDFLSLCNGECTIGEIFHKLAEMYSISEDVLLADFNDLILQWEKLNIVDM